jgi:hypothetical protein
MDTAQEKNTRDFLNVITSYDQHISKRASVCRPPLNIKVEDYCQNCVCCICHHQMTNARIVYTLRLTKLV